VKEGQAIPVKRVQRAHHRVSDNDPCSEPHIHQEAMSYRLWSKPMLVFGGQGCLFLPNRRVPHNKVMKRYGDGYRSNSSLHLERVQTKDVSLQITGCFCF